MPQTAKKNSWLLPNEKQPKRGDEILTSLALEMQGELIEQFERLQRAKGSEMILRQTRTGEK